MRTSISRRESEVARGSDVLGKLATAARRSSHYQHGDEPDVADEPVAMDNQRHHHHHHHRHTHRTSISSKGFGFKLAATTLRRFSRAADEPSTMAALPLVRMLHSDADERERRDDLECMDFGALHDAMAPPRPVVARPTCATLDEGKCTAPRDKQATAASDNQQEERSTEEMESAGSDDEVAAIRRKSRETTAAVDEVDADVDGNAGGHVDGDAARVGDDDHVFKLRLQPRGRDGPHYYYCSEASASGDASHSEELNDDDDDDHDNAAMDEGNDGNDRRDEEELNFDEANLCASVRKLVRKIESASLSTDVVGGGADAGASVLSNQDEDDEPSPTTRASDVGSSGSASGVVLLSPLDVEALERLRDARQIAANRAYVAPTAHVMGQPCYIPMDEVQEDLTTSVRRLVIGLKKESEADEEQPQGGLSPFARRRGNSCPAPYRPPVHSSAAVDSVGASTASISMATGPSEPPRWRKRSAFARLAPKFFDNFRRKRKSYLYTDEELESIEGARWKIVELAFRFGGKHRFYLVQAVNMFFPLIKYGRRGGPHPTRLHCNRCGTLQWQHKRGGLSESVDLADVLQIIEGRQTAVFRKYSSTKDLQACSLSIIFKERTLDLETQSSSHRDWLMSALRTLVAYARKQRQAEQRAIAECALMPLDEASGVSGSRSRQAEAALGHLPPSGSQRLLW